MSSAGMQAMLKNLISAICARHTKTPSLPVSGRNQLHRIYTLFGASVTYIVIDKTDLMQIRLSGEKNLPRPRPACCREVIKLFQKSYSELGPKALTENIVLQ
jgi:hypothetical protein